MHYITAPNTVQELQQRCQKLAGLTIQDLANILNLQVPADLNKAKGWVGQLLEAFLGATASSKPKPDFVNLGIELKTLPLNKNGQPSESTYVCTAQLNNDNLNWETSWIHNKLSHVLWAPFEASKDIPLKQRKFAMPFLWKPSKQQQEILKQDWEELTDMLCMGNVDTLTAKYGTYLQIRPKAANSKVLTTTINHEGYRIKTVPKGFYLRTSFTKTIIEANNLLWHI